MNAPYRPQAHAAELSELTALMWQALQQFATMRGDLDRVLAALPKPPKQDAAFDDLVLAIFEAMGSTTWITSEIVTRSLQPDATTHHLARCIAASGKTSPRALGKHLASMVPGPSYITEAGFELRRSGECGAVLAWHVVKV